MIRRSHNEWSSTAPVVLVDVVFVGVGDGRGDLVAEAPRQARVQDRLPHADASQVAEGKLHW